MKTINRLNQIKNSLDEKVIAKRAYTYFVKITPKDSGNARNKTTLSGNEIRASYPYAKRLDNGWSKQFGGQGMTKPTIEYIRKYIKKILGA